MARATSGAPRGAIDLSDGTRACWQVDFDEFVACFGEVAAAAKGKAIRGKGKAKAAPTAAPGKGKEKVAPVKRTRRQ